MMGKSNLREKPWSLAVFCGSRSGSKTAYGDQARLLGNLMAEKGVRLVFGAGHIGLMGAVADGVIEKGGQTFGVIPTSLVERELAHPGLTKLVQTKTMHERKAIMADHADAFVALPGGFGTLDEIFEILTWSQLGIHGKPVAILDCDGFFQGLLDWLRSVVQEGFLKEKCLENLRVFKDPGRLLEGLASLIDQTNSSVHSKLSDIR